MTAKDKYNDYIGLFPTKNLLGTFMIGKPNYGFKGEARYVTIYLPTFEELCFGLWPSNDMIDARLFYANVASCENGALEILFSKDYYINPAYDEFFKKNFIEKREEIAHLCEAERASKAASAMYEALDKRDFFEAVRLVEAMELFLKGVEAEFCFFMPFNDELVKVENGVLPNIQMLRQRMYECGIRASRVRNYNVEFALKKSILELMHMALMDGAKKESFEDCLNSEEMAVYNIIRGEVGKEGYITISRHVKESGYSKYIFKRVLEKMTESEVAEVINKGNRGTLVKFNV